MTNNKSRTKFNISSIEDIRTVLYLATTEQWPYEDRVLDRTNVQTITHQVYDRNSQKFLVSYLRMLVRCASTGTNTVDLRSVDGWPVKELLHRKHTLTPVAVFDFAHGRETPGLHFLSDVDTHLVLGRYVVPEQIELVYPFDTVAANDSANVLGRGMVDIPPSRYL